MTNKIKTYFNNHLETIANGLACIAIANGSDIRPYIG